MIDELVDTSKGGTITRTEFYQSIDEKASEFGDAIFALIGLFWLRSFHYSDSCLCNDV